MRTRSSSSFPSLARLLVLGAVGLLAGCSMSGGSAHGSGGGVILVAADAVRAMTTSDRRCTQHTYIIICEYVLCPVILALWKHIS